MLCVNMKLRTGVIPAAGMGKRIGYLGNILPKPLFPIFDKPIIHHVIDNMQRVGIDRVIVVVFHQKEMIIKYLRKADLGIDIEFVEPDVLPQGIALSIATTEERVNEPFMVILGDDVSVTPSLNNIVSSFFAKNALALEAVVEEKNKHVLSSTCCVQIDQENKIIDIVEKPIAPVGSVRGCGVYIFNETIFDLIRQTPLSKVRNEVEITDTIRKAANLGKAYVEFINGVNINVNTPEDMLRAWQLVRDTRSIKV